MITTYAERLTMRRRALGLGAPVGPGVASSIIYSVLAPVVPVVVGVGAVYAFSEKIIELGRWLFEKQDVPEISEGIREFLADEVENEQQDGAMTGEEIYLERTDPSIVMSSNALVIRDQPGHILVPGKVSMVCVRCKANMDITDNYSTVTCLGCGYGPITVRTGGRKRYCRGHFNMIRDTIKEFPQRMEHPNRRLAEQQVYTYMLRRSKELRWTVKDQSLLPALAAMTFLVRSRGEIDARKMAQSELADSAAYEYEVAGSRYPNMRRVYDSLRFYA